MLKVRSAECQDEEPRENRGGEWRGGVSPPRSLRTGREPLGSSGSQYPAVGIEKRPVREER
jgi:hypothetical protein